MTLRQPRRRMGAEAMKMLLALIHQENHRTGAPQQMLVQGELVVRRST